MSGLLVAPLEALTDRLLTDQERRVLMALFSFRGKDTNTVWPSIDSIAERAAINDIPRISKITKSLEEKGWLSKKRKGFTGCNQYTLMFPERLKNEQEITDTNLVNNTNLVDDANLEEDTNTNLVNNTKYKEQTIEHTNEQTNIHVGGTSPPACPHNEIIKIYNETLPMLPRVIWDKEKREYKNWKGSAREKNLRARWKQDAEYQQIEFWQWYFEKVKTVNGGWYIGAHPKNTTWLPDGIGYFLIRGNFDKLVERMVGEAAA